MIFCPFKSENWLFHFKGLFYSHLKKLFKEIGVINIGPYEDSLIFLLRLKNFKDYIRAANQVTDASFPTNAEYYMKYLGDFNIQLLSNIRNEKDEDIFKYETKYLKNVANLHFLCYLGFFYDDVGFSKRKTFSSCMRRLTFLKTKSDFLGVNVFNLFETFYEEGVQIADDDKLALRFIVLESKEASLWDLSQLLVVALVDPLSKIVSKQTRFIRYLIRQRMKVIQYLCLIYEVLLTKSLHLSL